MYNKFNFPFDELLISAMLSKINQTNFAIIKDDILLYQNTLRTADRLSQTFYYDYISIMTKILPLIKFDDNLKKEIVWLVTNNIFPNRKIINKTIKIFLQLNFLNWYTINKFTPYMNALYSSYIIKDVLYADEMIKTLIKYGSNLNQQHELLYKKQFLTPKIYNYKCKYQQKYKYIYLMKLSTK